MYNAVYTLVRMKTFKNAIEFEWDKWNIGKNKKHSVEDKESEETFLDPKRLVFKDILHSKVEERFVLIGRTGQERLLYVIFTMRGEKVRIISARDLNRKERNLYEKTT